MARLSVEEGGGRRRRSRDREGSYSRFSSSEEILAPPVHQGSSGGSLDRFTLTLTAFASLGGFLFGYDSGIINGALLLLTRDLQLTTFQKELTVSSAIAAAMIGALLTSKLAGRWGRRPAVLATSTIFVLGSVIMAAVPLKFGKNVGFSILVLGRVVAGLGIGGASMVVPVYISEAVPNDMRGRLVTVNNLFITGGQVFACIVAGIFSNTYQGWRYMLGLAMVPAIVQFFGFWHILPETPRWLLSNENPDAAREALERMRDKAADVSEEFEELRDLAQRADAHDSASSNFLAQISKPWILKSLALGMSLQISQQLIAINTVMYYSSTILTLAGFSTSSAIWLSVLVSGANFLFTFLGIYLVDRIGRRKLTLWSIAGATGSLAFLGYAFFRMQTTSVGVLPGSGSDDCASPSSCFECDISPGCGYCAITAQEGVCSAVNTSTASGSSCSYGNVSGEWSLKGCTARGDGILALLGLVMYLAAFAPGMGPMPWTINSEIFPQDFRSTGVGITTMCNWVVNFLVSLTFLDLVDVFTSYGAFWFYGGCGVLSFALFYITLPETRGLALEEIALLFGKPPYIPEVERRDDGMVSYNAKDADDDRRPLIK